jgi:hypothetical protein
MKKNLFYLFALICSMSLFTACSDDDDDKVVCPVPQTEFTVATGLNLTYNGGSMLGKKVTFTPDASDATKATLVLAGNLDLSGILTREAASGSFGAGVFPGSPVVTLPVTLNIQGDECSFSGTSETGYCTFDYAGKVTASSLKLDLTNVALKNSALSGTTWVPTPLNSDYTEEPIHLIWESNKNVEVMPGWELPIQTILTLALRMPLIDAGGDDKVNVEDMLCSVLHDITLGVDGNISASYVDAAQGGTSVVKTPANVAQYVVLSDTQMKVYLNLDAIIANVKRLGSSTKAIDMSEILSQAVTSLLPLVTDSVPLTYEKNEGKLKVYLNTDLLLPLMKNIVAPLFSDEEFVNMLIEAMKADPDFGSMAGMAEGMLKGLPEIINETTRLEVGLNLTAAK